MNIIGKWKLIAMMTVGENGLEMKPVEEVLKDDPDPKTEQYMNAITEYKADGTTVTLFPIPEGVSDEEIEEAKNNGEVFTEDNKFVVVDGNNWKEVDGVIYQDTGIQGDILGEEIDSFEAINIIDEDTFEIAFSRFGRIKD